MLVEHRSRPNQRVVGFVLGGVVADLVGKQRVCSHKCQSQQLSSNSSREKKGGGVVMVLTFDEWVRPPVRPPRLQNF